MVIHECNTMPKISRMGTILFWAAWLAVFTFFAVTTRAQRQGWLLSFWCLACLSLATTAALALLKQGYLTVA